MKRLLATVPLLVAALLGLGPAGEPRAKKATPTPTPTPEFEASEAPEPTPTPEPPRFLAALESFQGDGGDRIAVFADGTVASTVRWKERKVTKRISLSREELDVVRRVLDEAMAGEYEAAPRGDVLANSSERRMKLEVGSDGAARSWVFDDATSLPLGAGRARGALDDLRRRFESKSPVGEKLWDPAGVGLGDRLRRKSDNAVFLVARDDSFERNLELRSVDGSYVLWLARDQIPKIFHDPALPEPESEPPAEAR